jgi:hypothetical protein
LTTSPLNIQLDNTKSTVRVSGITHAITSNALPANVGFVQWDGAKGSGLITYNDRTPIPEVFLDLSPYQTYVDQWMTSAAFSTTPALILDQAQSIKNGFVDGLWAGKRQAPIVVSTSLGMFTFDASDSSWSTMWMAVICTLNAAANTALAALTASAQTGLTGLKNSINQNIVAVFSADAANLQSQLVNNWNALNTEFGGTGFSMPGTSAMNGFGNTTFTNLVAPTVLALDGSSQILPLGATTFPPFTVADVAAVVSAIQAQRNSTMAARNDRQISIMSFRTIQDVVAFDATAGW